MDLLVNKIVPLESDISIAHDELVGVDIPRQEVGDCRELGAVASGIVVQLKQWNCEKLHVFWDRENL